MPTSHLFTTAEAAEAAFYEALRRGDLRALMAVWADDEEILCIHPGGKRLVGLEAVRQSWTAVLSDGGLDVRPRDARSFDSVATCVRCVIEQVRVQTPSGTRVAECLATNVFGRGGAGWRLLVHHACPGRELATEPMAHSGVLH